MKNHPKYKEFMSTLEEAILCPYCGVENQLDPPTLCCGEVHAEAAWLNEDEEAVYESDLPELFDAWLKEQRLDYLD